MRIDYTSKSYEDLVLDAEIYNQLIEEADQRAKIAEGCDEYAERRIEAMTVSLLSIREEIKKKRKNFAKPLDKSLKVWYNIYNKEKQHKRKKEVK